MSRLRSRAWTAIPALLLLGVVGLATTGIAGPARHPAALKAEDRFFAVFNQDPRSKSAPLRDLLVALMADPDDGRTNLLLGLNHLWLGAEGDKTNPLTLEHVILAERYLTRAQELNPADRRIPSWLVPARLSLARLQGKKDEREKVWEELLAAYREDPAFHSFTVALLGVDKDRTSPEFRRGLEVLRATDSDCRGEKEDPTCLNQPHWPHNQEAFETFRADYELKAGHAARARELLLGVQSIPSYRTWKFQSEVEDRLENLEAFGALYANADPGDDPPHLMSASSGFLCQTCHLGP